MIEGSILILGVPLEDILLVLGVVISAVFWLARLESKVFHLRETFKECKKTCHEALKSVRDEKNQVHSEIWNRIDDHHTEILELLGEINRKIGSLNGRSHG